MGALRRAPAAAAVCLLAAAVRIAREACPLRTPGHAPLPRHLHRQRPPRPSTSQINNPLLPPNAEVATDCAACTCPFADSGRSCSLQTGGGVLCNCPVGYDGQFCQVCAAGWFGNPLIVGGACQPCDCSGNSDPANDPNTCDSVTGQCLACINNSAGSRCELCASGFFGNALTQTCTGWRNEPDEPNGHPSTCSIL